MTLVTEPIGRSVTDDLDPRSAPDAAFASSARRDRTPTGAAAAFASPVAALAAGAATPPATTRPAITAPAASPPAIRMRTPPGRPNEDTRILSVRPVFGCGLRVNFLPNGSVLRLDRARDLVQVASAGGPAGRRCDARRRSRLSHGGRNRRLVCGMIEGEQAGASHERARRATYGHSRAAPR